MGQDFFNCAVCNIILGDYSDLYTTCGDGEDHGCGTVLCKPCHDAMAVKYGRVGRGWCKLCDKCAETCDECDRVIGQNETEYSICKCHRPLCPECRAEAVAEERTSCAQCDRVTDDELIQWLLKKLALTESEATMAAKAARQQPPDDLMGVNDVDLQDTIEVRTGELACIEPRTAVKLTALSSLATLQVEHASKALDSYTYSDWLALAKQYNQAMHGWSLPDSGWSELTLYGEKCDVVIKSDGTFKLHLHPT